MNDNYRFRNITACSFLPNQWGLRHRQSAALDGPV